MAEVLVDTDVLVDHLRGHRAFIAGKDRVHYSVLTRAELFAGRNVDDAVVTTLLAPFTEVGVDRAIAERGGRLRRAESISLADAIIAATAMEHGLTLLTGNGRDFGRITGLKVRLRDRSQ
jgi:predicted nucleic acid-binding protein